VKKERASGLAAISKEKERKRQGGGKEIKSRYRVTQGQEEAFSSPGSKRKTLLCLPMREGEDVREKKKKGKPRSRRLEYERERGASGREGKKGISFVRGRRTQRKGDHLFVFAGGGDQKKNDPAELKRKRKKTPLVIGAIAAAQRKGDSTLEEGGGGRDRFSCEPRELEKNRIQMI